MADRLIKDFAKPFLNGGGVTGHGVSRPFVPPQRDSLEPTEVTEGDGFGLIS